MENYTKKFVNHYGDVFYFNAKGQCHRLDGPAAEWTDGDKEWYMNGKRHREAGPAIEYSSYKLLEWWIDDKFFKKSNHNRLVLFSILEPRRLILVSTEGK